MGPVLAAVVVRSAGGTDDTARALRDGIWIAVICLPVGWVALRLLGGRRRRRYLFR